MQIRKKLTLQFISIVAVITLLSSLAVYFFSADYRKDDFYNRLSNKANNTAKLLISVEEVDANLLRKIERDNPTSLPQEKIIIYNYKNEILYSSDETKTLKINDSLLDRIRLEHEIRFRQGAYEVLGFLFTEKFDRFVVIAGAVDIYGFNKLRNLRTILMVVFGVSTLLVFLAGWIYSGRALRPISRVIDQVGDISITSLNLRVDEGNGQDEIAHLAGTFNKMLDRLERAFKVQKNFIANASHELRTPLTVITGQLEVLLLKERNKEEYKSSLSSILEDMKSLNSISNRLLLLAQASSEATEKDFYTVRADEAVWQAESELLKRNPEYRIKTELSDDLDEDGLSVRGNEQLLKTAFINLMENACKYSSNHEVKIRLSKEVGSLKISFSDKGTGIAPEDADHIFEPFHRGKNTLTIKGHGIGLSIVERIITLHKGAISLHSVPDEGSTFTLILPLL